MKGTWDREHDARCELSNSPVCKCAGRAEARKVDAARKLLFRRDELAGGDSNDAEFENYAQLVDLLLIRWPELRR